MVNLEEIRTQQRAVKRWGQYAEQNLNPLARRYRLFTTDRIRSRRRELIDDPDQRAQMDRELDAWVTWLVNRYRLALKIPACWHQHGQIVEELTALWYAWRAAWITPASGWDPTRWHHDLTAMLQRIAGTYPVPCSGSEHKPNSAADRTSSHGAIELAQWWPSPIVGDL